MATKSGRRSSSSTTARVKRGEGRAKPAGAKGTKPIAMLGLYIGLAPTPLAMVRVFPSVRKDAPSWAVIDAPEAKAKNAKRSSARKPTGTSAAERPQVVEVVGGGKTEHFPIGGAQLKEFRDFEQALLDSRGIAILACLPARAVTATAVVSTYFLAPTDAGESRENYKALVDILWATNKVLFVQMRRKEAIVRCVIVASESALYMWQLAPVGATHKMHDLIEPAAWSGIDVLPQHRALLSRMLESCSSETVADNAGDDPRNEWLRLHLQGARYGGQIPLKTSDKGVPSLRNLAHELGVS